jgi:methyl-accepting chemotaxis protein
LAATVAEVRRQAHDLVLVAQHFAASAQELQAASQEISATTQALTDGTQRQRDLLGQGRTNTEQAATTALTLHDWAQEAERQVGAIATKARAHGDDIARSSQLQTLIPHRPAGTAAPIRRPTAKPANWWTASHVLPVRRSPGAERDHRGRARRPAQLGFRVVADEVRKLADQTGKSADEVRARIKEMTSQVSGVVGALNEGRSTAKAWAPWRTACDKLWIVFADLNTTCVCHSLWQNASPAKADARGRHAAGQSPTSPTRRVAARASFGGNGAADGELAS